MATKKSQARRSSFCWVWLGSGLPSMARPSSADRSYQPVVRIPPSAVPTSARTWTETFCWSGLGAKSFQFCSNSGKTHSSTAAPCCLVSVLDGATCRNTSPRWAQTATAATARATRAPTW